MCLQDWLLYIEKIHPEIIELGLARVQEVATRLQCTNFYCPVIMVGGTNGKGSCVATIRSITAAAGLKSGVYTSPHLVSFNERILIDGKQVTDILLCRAFARVEKARGDILLTYFEFTTLAALILFQEADLDLVILEVGLGGRLDAVNIVEPDISIITSIGFDHQHYLGNSLTEIAREKAGIMRPGKPTIIGAIEAFELLQSDNDSFQLISAGVDYHYHIHANHWSWGTSHNTILTGLKLPSFPVANAATALAAIMQLRDPRFTSEHLYQGVAAVRIPGRFQVIQERPITIVDVAHNEPATIWLAAQLIACYPQVKEWHAVFTCQKDKAVLAMVATMKPVISVWHVIDLQRPQTIAVSQIDAIFGELRIPYILYKDAVTTVAALQAEISPKAGIIIFGTFMLAGYFMPNP